ncbi:probable inactive poly [ADP-ribose] polymerase SRO2 isoform X1 [Musa acuminata AAA Group]|uniref:probable inactive poly [ADP-ribose] polymerase SRO2 isoform X1 n=1 Tax=Musa acuminata AAA Group TaxID=214697 RepID=UPI0031D8C782
MAGRPATGGFAGGDAMIKVDKDSDEFVIIQHRFYTNMGSTVPHCPLVELHRILYSTPTGRARLEAFNRQVDAMKQKHGGNPNERFAFYEASKRNVQRIINDGFDVSAAPEDFGYFGIALYLSPEPCAINSVMSATVDEKGLRHVLLCRVILGGAEEVVRGSGQSRPSSGNFDSAVDNHRSPTRYIIWYPDVQSRVLPLYVLSVEVDFRNRVLHQALVSRPTSPWMSIGDLLSALSARLPHSTMCQLRRLHNDTMEKKITTEQMVRSIREITGDQMLLDAMRTILGRFGCFLCRLFLSSQTMH